MSAVTKGNTVSQLPEGRRLDQQGETLDENLGFLIHPSISATLPPKPVIADIGTGTGAYLIELSKLYPNATLHGFDISPALFPEPKSLPCNVHLEVRDVRELPSESLYGTFDYIHVRLIASGVHHREWPAVIRTLVLQLKPGGAIQWLEGNWSSLRAYRGSNSPASTPMMQAAISRLTGALAGPDPNVGGWTILPGAFKTAGLLAVEEDIVRSDRVPETRKKWTTTCLAGVFDKLRILESRKESGALGKEEIEQMEKAANREAEADGYAAIDIHVVVGFKERPEDVLAKRMQADVGMGSAHAAAISIA